jgi:hypothetical protein
MIHHNPAITNTCGEVCPLHPLLAAAPFLAVMMMVAWWWKENLAFHCFLTWFCFRHHRRCSGPSPSSSWYMALARGTAEDSESWPQFYFFYWQVLLSLKRAKIGEHIFHSRQRFREISYGIS